MFRTSMSLLFINLVYDQKGCLVLNGAELRGYAILYQLLSVQPFFLKKGLNRKSNFLLDLLRPSKEQVGLVVPCPPRSYPTLYVVRTRQVTVRSSSKLFLILQVLFRLPLRAREKGNVKGLWRQKETVCIYCACVFSAFF